MQDIRETEAARETAVVGLRAMRGPRGTTGIKQCPVQTLALPFPEGSWVREENCWLTVFLCEMGLTSVPASWRPARIVLGNAQDWSIWQAVVSVPRLSANLVNLVTLRRTFSQWP